MSVLSDSILSKSQKFRLFSKYWRIFFSVFSSTYIMHKASQWVFVLCSSLWTLFKSENDCSKLKWSSIGTCLKCYVLRTIPTNKWMFSFLKNIINPLKPELNPICYLLALLAHHFLHVSRIRVKSLTFRRLMSYIYKYIYIYIYGAPILDVSRSHTTTQHSR